MVSIVNYKMGNIRSIVNALSFLGVASQVVNQPEQIITCSKLILPGVGSFGMAMEHIKSLNLFTALNTAVLGKKVPILGICLGMQLLAEEGDEDGPTKGFGWIPGRVERFPAKNLSLKIPHIGFNTAFFESKFRSLFQDLKISADFYFVHSYRFICAEPDKYVSAWSNYGEKFAACVEKDNIFGTQFHPEKSQSNGLMVLKNFCQLNTTI